MLPLGILCPNSLTDTSTVIYHLISDATHCMTHSSSGPCCILCSILIKLNCLLKRSALCMHSELSTLFSPPYIGFMVNLLKGQTVFFVRSDWLIVLQVCNALTWLPQDILKAELIFDSVGEIFCIGMKKKQQRKGLFRGYNYSTFTFWALQVNLPLNMNNSFKRRNSQPQNDWKGKWNQIIVFNERKCFARQNKHFFLDLINIILKKLTRNTSIVQFVPKRRNPQSIFK